MKTFGGRIQKVKHPHLLILLSSTAYQQEYESALELFLFHVQYSFLFSNNDKIQKTCDLKTNYFLVSQENGENGARYLDPKYSRWLSTDPALGEYVPAAGKGNANDAGNLPGMGGIYNSVNCNLYHYAGNNPIRYVDPTGLFDIEEFVNSIKQLFNNEKDFKSRFALYYCVPYNPDDFNPEKEEGSFWTCDREVTPYICKISDYGKLSTCGKILVLLNEYNSLVDQFNDKTDGLDAIERLIYGLGETLFSANSVSSEEEFLLTCFSNTAEAFADFVQFSLDQDNLRLKMNIYEKEINRLLEVYKNE